MSETPPVVRAPRGTELTCKGWLQEAALRMLMNNLDPDVAEAPEKLVVYGGTGKAARSWPDFHQIVATLKRLEDDETMLVQSGRVVGVFPTHRLAPRVLLANSLLVPEWGTWEEFRRLEAMGLTMYGQMTAGSWIYIGSQGIVQGTYETFAAIAEQRFGGSLKGRIVLTAGLGGMGGAQPLAITMNGGVALCVEIDSDHIDRRIRERYCDERYDDIDEAIIRAEEARANGEAVSIGLLGNAAEVLPALLDRNFLPDIVTDQTSAHDPLVGYIHRGAEVFDYGNALRTEARTGGLQNAFDYPGFVEAYVRPLFCRGIGPFRWAALSGDPNDIAVTDAAMRELFPDNERLQRWLDGAQEKIAFQGLPARICWIGHGERHRAGLRFNELVAAGDVAAPLVIGRDHLDSGSVASPYRETEGMKDGSDAIADWPVLNAMLNVASGAAWVALHHGGGVGIGRSIHSGAQVVADGTEEGAFRVERVLWNDPGTGVMRHAHAGYDSAKQAAKSGGLDLPGITT